ncbi:MAG: hypothetical protein C5B50_12260 [Verrucomicrobia bacterium]|nr:MAG: hypothetical protein C5B50_12260 [Verrucomicrobiota bacterium]
MKLRIWPVCLLAAAASPRGLAQLDQGLIAWYQFNGNGNDSSGNANNATAHGSPTYVPGPVGEATCLDGGSAYFECPINLNAEPSISIAFWFKALSFSRHQRYQLVSNDNGHYGRVINFSGTDGTAGAPGPGDLYPFFCAGEVGQFSKPLSLNTWYHVAAVWTPTRTMLYTNGVLAISGPGGTACTSDKPSLFVGYPTSGAGETDYTHGCFGDLRIYSRALSTQEIAALAKPLPTATTKTVATLKDQMIRERDLTERLADVTSEVGRDAHRAAELLLVMKRNETRRMAGAIDPANETQDDAGPRSELGTIQTKYAPGGALADRSRDFSERVNNLVHNGVQEKGQQWAQEAANESRAKARHDRSNTSGTQPTPKGRSVVLSALCYGGYFALLIFAAIKSLGGEVGLDRDGHKMLTGGQSYALHWKTGTVIRPEKDREVHTHVRASASGGASGSASSVSVTTTTITNLEFFIRNKSGEEYPIQVSSANHVGLAESALREGHILSAVWAIQDGRNSGSYVLLRNHSTGQTVYDEGALHDMMHLKRPWSVLSCILAAPTCLGFIVLYSGASIVKSRRATKVKEQIAERLIPQLDREATSFGTREREIASA